jgi:hypothetical protein
LWDKIKSGVVRAYLWPIAKIARNKIKSTVEQKVSNAVAEIDHRFPLVER